MKEILENKEEEEEEEEEGQQGLIPDLPEDIALDCIARIPFASISNTRPVCKKWRHLVSSPTFSRHRLTISAAEDLIFLIQTADKPPATPPTKISSLPPSHVTFYNATLSTWHHVPSPYPDPIPIFSQIAAVDGKVVVLGGWHPVTLLPVADVKILDLSTMTWRRGEPMSSPRSFFACAADGGKVYVAGGHDHYKNALRSAEVYDVARDEWLKLPAMSEERDEAKGLILGGKFWAVSGYKTESQGRFATSAEWYDGEKGDWVKIEGVWDCDTCTSCFGSGERMWSLDPKKGGGGGVREFDFDRKEWKEGMVPVGPAGLAGTKRGTCLVGAVMGDGERVMITEGKGGLHWVVDLGSGEWIQVEAPVGFLGPVYSAVAVRI